MQRRRNHAHGLELLPAIANALLVHGERLREELVRHLLVARLVGDLAGRDEEAEGEVGGRRGRGADVQCGEEGVGEFVEG